MFELALDPLFTMRPVLDGPGTRPRFPGLFLCSSRHHSGNGLTGAPGANAASEIIHASADLLLRFQYSRELELVHTVFSISL